MVLNFVTAVFTGWLVFDGLPNNRLDPSLVLQLLVLVYFVAAMVDYFYNVEFYFQGRQPERIIERLERIEARLDMLAQAEGIANLKTRD